MIDLQERIDFYKSLDISDLQKFGMAIGVKQAITLQQNDLVKKIIEIEDGEIEPWKVKNYIGRREIISYVYDLQTHKY